ncbi:unnamed protein product [Clavelina lepadiformis]|uniref:Uncharacterized protein n=1 Tax=Clavelina lepadiformis TaxID=159417 RepID=A0ABP0FTX9_CLALP
MECAESQKGVSTTMNPPEIASTALHPNTIYPVISSGLFVMLTSEYQAFEFLMATRPSGCSTHAQTLHPGNRLTFGSYKDDLNRIFQNDLVAEMISHDVIPLFLQYFTILIDDGNEYPIDSVRYGFLEVLKGLVFNMTETSSEFCFECCKQGLITLMAVHLQYLQGLFWLPLEVKGYAEQKAVGILYNCAKRPEPLIYAKVQNTFEIMSDFRHEMVKEVGPERMEFLTFVAFSVTYMAEEDQLGFLKVHQSLINYIVEVSISKAVGD